MVTPIAKNYAIEKTNTQNLLLYQLTIVSQIITGCLGGTAVGEATDS